MDSSINKKLIELLRISKLKTKEFFENSETINAINKRKNIKKFGKACNKDNCNITTVSYIEVFIEAPEKEHDNKINNESNKNKIKCRYCNGDHMSFKCKNKNGNKENKKTNTIKISNLPSDITEEELIDLLSDYGIIEKVTIPEEIKYNNDIIKHAYIRLQDYATASEILNELDNTNFDNHVVGVSYV